jgi:hypothetical protein
MILLVFLAMAAIVAIAAFIGYTVTRNTTASGAAHTSTFTKVTRQANIWQADSARANPAEASAATAVEAIATDTAGSLVLTPTSEGRRTR